MEVQVIAILVLLTVLFALPIGTSQAAGLSLGPRVELTHPSTGHDAHLSGAAVVVAPDGVPLVTWAAQEGEVKHLYVARMGGAEPRRVRANPAELTVEALHHPPRLAVATTGQVYLSWSSAKPKPEGTLFASDLRLSHSLDNGQSFAGHVRVNDDRPISHSFDGLTVAGDGTVLVTWLDSRTGGANAGAYLARVTDGGTRVESVVRVGQDVCVCCRVDAAAGPVRSRSSGARSSRATSATWC